MKQDNDKDDKENRRKGIKNKNVKTALISQNTTRYFQYQYMIQMQNIKKENRGKRLKKKNDYDKENWEKEIKKKNVKTALTSQNIHRYFQYQYYIDAENQKRKQGKKKQEETERITENVMGKVSTILSR